MIDMNKKPLILNYCETVSKKEVNTIYDSKLDMNVIIEMGKKIPFYEAKKELWAYETKTLRVRERDD